MATLDEVKTGVRAVITEVRGDGRFVSRVTSVGLTQGCELEVLQNVKSRPVLVFARDSAIALDRGDCGRIFVEVRL